MTNPPKEHDMKQDAAPDADGVVPPKNQETSHQEIGGQKGPEPTRYGDWEKGGRCTDF